MNLWLWILLLGVLSFLAALLVCYQWISISTKPYLYDHVKNLSKTSTLLLLGTARLTRRGKKNLFFSHRIEKAAAIYHHHKINQILISGADKAPSSEDEVEDMLNELVQKGVEVKHTIKDKKGYRTWTSIWRCKNIYHISSPIIVSQRFHNQRAVFIALRMGLSPIAINAESVRGKAHLRIILRETLARVKCIIDCYLFSPKH